ncbi:uncharacterized protein LOC118821110 [Colossoma macropomum]|uniref:uncharacterized protein LOC118821110 n=1 Tax=Colossoma macropomum TaxID=42526 RepID=UPI0018649CCF|nr:uncharacterized protein LOC118821110 [Colossoma macropomum]XP_036445442.1 uncharacterized protein LOC118821110 [Colossoma macropomum]XP_036445443.1 uncharacterized protein LOC118821110 [Colossoma macropomum]
MKSTGLQQNFIWFVENKTKEAPSRRLCCEKCRFSTKDIELFERHVAHHEEVTFSCTLCSHVSYSRVESQRHIVTHKGSYPYKCNWCSYGAVRRDYMVKHIQRIHGKPADGSFTTDCTIPNAKIEHLSQQQITDLCPDISRTSGEPIQNVKFVSHSAGNVFSLLPSVSQPRPSAPYLVVRPVHQTTSNQTHLICSTAAQSVTSTTCILPVSKTVNTPHSLPSTSHLVSKVTQSVSNPPNITVNEVDHRLPGKTSLGKASSPSALPRVHVSIPADRAIPQKTLLQSQVGATTEKTVIQSRTVSNSQVVCISSDHTIQQNPLLQTQEAAVTEKTVSQSKSVSKNQIAFTVGTNTHLKTLLSNPLESFGQRAVEAQNVPTTLPAQRPVHTGVIRNLPVAHAVQRSLPSGAHPSSPVERFGQGAPSITLRTQCADKTNRRKTRPNILAKRPAEKLEPSTQSSVQVELLAPLNQPIEHNRPLTVSCPEEITIPAGCLVELVEVKNVNGTRELELRLVPQQPTGPQLVSSRSTTPDSTANRLSFKCKVAPGDNGPTRLIHGTSSLQTNAIPEPPVKGSHLKEHSTDVKVGVKDEPEVKVLWSKISVTETPGSLSGGFYNVPRAVARPLESHQPSTGRKNVAKATEPVTPVRQMHCRGSATSQSANSVNGTVEGPVNEHRATRVSLNKHEDVESSYQGLPVISSVFSLCPSPEATLNGIHTRVGILDEHVVGVQTSSGSESKKTVANDSTVCKTDLKTEEETGLMTENNPKSSLKLKEKDCLLEDTKVLDAVVPEKRDNAEKSPPKFPDDPKDKIMPEMCSSSTDTPQTDADQSLEMNVSPLNINDFSPQREEREQASMSESNVLVQREGHPALPMNPTVALARIPSLDFYSLVESAKKVSKRATGEESITARPVLCCTSNQQNVQERAIKLVLKRKRSESENRDSGQVPQPVLAQFAVQSPYKKHKKEKKSAKKHKSSKVMLGLNEILVKGKIGKLWLTPLKEDQLVKLPAPNQPVVVLNLPNSLLQMVSQDVQTQKNYELVSPSHSPHTQTEEATPAELVTQCPSFKMKLKKVQGRKYEVTELVLKGVSEKMIL